MFTLEVKDHIDNYTVAHILINPGICALYCNRALFNISKIFQVSAVTPVEHSSVALLLSLSQISDAGNSSIFESFINIYNLFSISDLVKMIV